MLAPLPHAREPERLTAVRALRLYGAEPPQALDHLTFALSASMEVPIAMVTVIEEIDIWFLSCVGLPARQGPRELSICGHTILQSRELVVPDTRLDGRFCDNPSFIGSPPIVAYAGAAISNDEGLPIGTVCVVDHVPREFTAAQLEILRCFAALVQREIFAQRSIEKARQDLNDERAALHRSELLFTTIFQTSPVGKAIVALDGRWIQVNPALCEIVGYSHDELMQRSFQDITYPDDLDADLEMVRQCIDGEIGRYQIEKRYVRKDGGTVWVNLTVAINRPVDAPPYFISVIEDITTRKETENSLRALRLGLERKVAERTSELERTNERLLTTMADALHAGRQVRAREHELRIIIEHAPDAYVSTDEAGVISAWNAQAEKTFGWSADEAIGRRIEETIFPARLRNGLRGGFHQALVSPPGHPLRERAEISAVHRDGHAIPVEIRLKRIEIDGAPMIIAFLHDISERKAAEADRLSAQRRLQLIADNVPALVSYSDTDFRYVWANQAYREYFGVDPAELIGREMMSFFEDGRSAEMLDLMRRALAGESVTVELDRPFRGRPYYWLVKYVPDIVRGNVVGIHGMILDITERKLREVSLSRDANIDPLTGLMNRRGLFKLLGEQLGHANARGESMGVLLLDLNGFKEINDSLGHPAGDAVLGEVGRRLSGIEGATAARLGGDEFVMVIPGLRDGSPGLDAWIAEIGQALGVPVDFDGHLIPVAASIGSCTSRPNEAIEAEELLYRADASMYLKKKSCSRFLRSKQPPARR